jgi:hypothetical protein
MQYTKVDKFSRTSRIIAVVFFQSLVVLTAFNHEMRVILIVAPVGFPFSFFEFSIVLAKKMSYANFNGFPLWNAHL